MPAIERPILTDGELTLRPPRPEDADAITACCQDPEIPRWTTVPSPYHREHAIAYVERTAAEARTGRTAAYVMVDADDRVIGSFSVMEMDRGPGFGEIGYWVAAGARRRGTATRAVRLLREWAHAALGLTVIEALVHVENLASRRVAENAGFVDTGERRPAPRTEDPGPPRYAVYAWRAPSAA